MKVSLKWLSRYVDLSGISAEKLADTLTLAGLEVESVEPVAQGSNLVIGEVLECEKHPESDHLSKTLVNTGDEVVSIVCGAPNVRKGQKVFVAKAGAVLPTGPRQRQGHQCGRQCGDLRGRSARRKIRRHQGLRDRR